MIAAFFDVDGTLTKTRVWNGLKEYFRVHRLRWWSRFLFDLYHYPLMILYFIKILPEQWFRTIWASHLSWYFRGYSVDDAEEIWNWVVLNYVKYHWREDVRKLIDEHKRDGHLIFLVSGGPQPLVNRIGVEVGADYAVGSLHQVRNGIYTGRESGPICIDQNKVSMVRDLIANKGLNLDLRDSYAYADSVGDIPLLEFVGNPRLVYPNIKLRRIGEERGWEIISNKVEDFG
jgi:HAD superfamily hydrolase (TIGR01490 family)